MTINWSEIPDELARKIAAEHMGNLEDFDTFGEVCSRWRSAIKGVNFRPSKNTQLPWLMLTDPPNSSYRRFYSLSRHIFTKIYLPQLDDEDNDDHRTYFSSKGWLLSLSRKNLNITLFHPFSGKVIKPPSVQLELMEFSFDQWDDTSYQDFLCKFILSANPSECDDDYTVAILFERTQLLAFWRPGEHAWAKPAVDFHIHWVCDVCFFQGEFYAIDSVGKVMAFGSEKTNRKPRIVADLISQGVLPKIPINLYLVEVKNKLLVIHRYVFVVDEINKDEDVYWTKYFEVFELNVDNGKAKQVHDVGDRAIFLGYNSTFSVKASSHKDGCKSNCIYFTDDNGYLFRGLDDRNGGGSDMGIYSIT
ncbi:putative F-box protein At1g65770 [Spinacia oleracea]|uniref:F-box protein At1g65770 n=1 Tax=Spinacia oleracea TaxID=3562 RepID=A0ABM3QW21_SPIOL|nr:putative F-box protein At1g65770 [Spinacia oleracea]